MGTYQYIRREPRCVNPVGSNKQLYCSCTAGLLGSSNHVARLLFRVEAVVLTEFCNQTCTNTLATWNIPRGIKQIQSDEASKFLFAQDTYMKKATQETLEKHIFDILTLFDLAASFKDSCDPELDFYRCLQIP